MGTTIRDQPMEPAAGRQKNRRAFVRRDSSGIVLCRTGKMGMGPELRGRLRNVSQGGALVKLPKQVEAGTELTMEFTSLACRKGFVVAAVVQRARPGDEGDWHAVCEFEKRIPYSEFVHLFR